MDQKTSAAGLSLDLAGFNDYATAMAACDCASTFLGISDQSYCFTPNGAVPSVTVVTARFPSSCVSVATASASSATLPWQVGGNSVIVKRSISFIPSSDVACLV